MQLRECAFQRSCPINIRTRRFCSACRLKKCFAIGMRADMILGKPRPLHLHMCTLESACVYWAVRRSWFARVNALCNLSRKKSREVAASLPGRFLSRCCFTLCITMEVEPRIANQYKCHNCCNCKNYRGKGWREENKCLCVIFLLTRRSRVRGKNAFWGIL